MSKTSAHRLSEGWLPLQSITGPACRRPLGRGASLEFLPLQRVQMREPTYPGFASSRFGCGCRVSHPLAALRLPRPSDRLRPVTLMGFSPSKLLPPDGAVAPLGTRCPPAVVGTRRTQPKLRTTVGRPDFRALLPAGVRHDRTGISRAAARCSPGVSVALGHSSTALPPASRRLPSQASSRFGFRRGDRPPRVSIRSRGAALLNPKIDRSRNPSAILAPRFPSACFELRRPGLAPNGSGDIAVPELRSMGRP
jgi:hypothetical protein